MPKTLVTNVALDPELRDVWEVSYRSLLREFEFALQTGVEYEGGRRERERKGEREGEREKGRAGRKETFLSCVQFLPSPSRSPPSLSGKEKLRNARRAKWDKIYIFLLSPNCVCSSFCLVLFSPPPPGQFIFFQRERVCVRRGGRREAMASTLLTAQKKGGKGKRALRTKRAPPPPHALRAAARVFPRARRGTEAREGVGCEKEDIVVYEEGGGSASAVLWRRAPALLRPIVPASSPTPIPSSLSCSLTPPEFLSLPILFCPFVVQTSLSLSQKGGKKESATENSRYVAVVYRFALFIFFVFVFFVVFLG